MPTAENSEDCWEGRSGTGRLTTGEAVEPGQGAIVSSWGPTSFPDCERLGVGEAWVALDGDGEGERSLGRPTRGGEIGTEEPVLEGDAGLEEDSLTGRLA
jgi:hypothetical protein